ncbi:MAG: hypothetical protein AAGJ46_00750 [Planctomycetota bacterium]
MNLDATKIAIRERSFGEIMDLALVVIRQRFGPLLVLLAVGAAPWALLNHFLTSRLILDSIGDEEAVYVFWRVLLVVLETPLATAPITLYLGQVTFGGRGDARKIAGDFFRSLPQMIMLQGLARVLTAIPFVTLFMPYVMWPYLSELILLERNPMFGGKTKDGRPRLNTRRRSKNLHRNSGGDLFSRWLLSAAAGVMLIVIGIVGVQALARTLFAVDISIIQTLLYVFPAITWVVVGYFTVVRFLAYLDLRIRREGWEVELALRAQAARLASVGAVA